jgi:hypothetical protein
MDRQRPRTKLSREHVAKFSESRRPRRLMFLEQGHERAILSAIRNFAKS